MFGVTTWHLRMLTENPWNEGAGYSYEEVGRMTPDQVYHRLCDANVLRRKGGRRTAKAKAAALATGEGGRIKGRAGDGTPIEGRIGGESLARRLMREEREKKERQKKRRNRRGN
jgi:hypothetical protein